MVKLKQIKTISDAVASGYQTVYASVALPYDQPMFECINHVVEEEKKAFWRCGANRLKKKTRLSFCFFCLFLMGISASVERPKRSQCSLPVIVT